MSDPELVKSWKVTETLLERARHALPDAPVDHEQACIALLAQYREFLEHNELELTLDVLEELGHLISSQLAAAFGAIWSAPPKIWAC
ncbi:hypothetical protein ACVIGB_004209 [Bradyrhizobium sp. USDA 4341]